MRRSCCPAMNVSAAFIRHPVATTLIMAAIFLVGVVAPVAPLPQVDFPTIQVSAALPAPVPTMESSVCIRSRSIA
jgi:hydrophobic/amphiphilic exporter-1 (mainly G- bacteria), HAE1 family